MRGPVDRSPAATQQSGGKLIPQATLPIRIPPKAAAGRAYIRSFPIWAARLPSAGPIIAIAIVCHGKIPLSNALQHVSANQNLRSREDEEVF